ELIQRAGVFLRQQTALRQRAVKFDICRIRFGGQLEIFRSVLKAFCTIAAQTQQSARLQILRISCEGRAQRSDGGIEMLLFEFSQSPVQMNSRQLRIQSDRFSVGWNRL